MAGLSLVFLICFMGTCNSCSTSRKMDEQSVAITKLSARVDSSFANQSKSFELQQQLAQPQIVNQFLNLFNAAQYKNEIDLNNEKINGLQQQIKNLKQKNDTARKNR